MPRDVTVFKILYGEVLLRRHEDKITSGDVTTRVVVRLSTGRDFDDSESSPYFLYFPVVLLARYRHCVILY